MDMQKKYSICDSKSNLVATSTCVANVGNSPPTVIFVCFLQNSYQYRIDPYQDTHIKAMSDNFSYAA